MSLKLAFQTLYSTNPEKLASFWSEVFEAEISPVEVFGQSAVRIETDFFQIRILKAQAQRLFSSTGLRDYSFTFELDSLSDLEDLLHKIQFMMFRHGQEDKKKIKLEKGPNDYFFRLNDPDGREIMFFTPIETVHA